MLADMQRRVRQGEYRQVAQWGAVCLFRRQPR